MQIFTANRITSCVDVCFKAIGKVQGTVRGPFCKYSRTLPSTYPITDNLARVVDPCYWTPRLPFRYEITASFTDGEGNTQEHQFLWGLRRCEPHKDKLRLDGKGFVVRGVQATDNIDLELLRELSAALVVTRADDPLCQQASEMGILVIDQAGKQQGDSPIQAWPAAVHFSAGPRADVPADVLTISSDSDGNVLLCNEADVPGPPTARPIFVERRVESHDVADMRKACDTLQKDMAQIGQFAGYIISHP